MQKQYRGDEHVRLRMGRCEMRGCESLCGGPGIWKLHVRLALGMCSNLCLKYWREGARAIIFHGLEFLLVGGCRLKLEARWFICILFSMLAQSRSRSRL